MNCDLASLLLRGLWIFQKANSLNMDRSVSFFKNEITIDFRAVPYCAENQA
jgi:hypothetical protein